MILKFLFDRIVALGNGGTGTEVNPKFGQLNNRSSKHLPVLYGRHAIKPQFYFLMPGDRWLNEG